MAGSGSAIKEGDLAPMCFQLIDFQMVAKLTVPGPFQPHRTLCETGTKKGKTFRFFLGSRPNTPNLEPPIPGGVTGTPGFFGQSDELN